MISTSTYKVGVYLRISRDDDSERESESISNQRDIITAYAKDNNYEIVEEYVDDGYSGTNFDRPGFIQMKKDIENRKINMVITKDMSRLGREHIDTSHYVERYFPEKGIRYIAILDNIDTAIDMTTNNVPLKAVINDMYAKDISNKIRSVVTRKKKNGQHLGGTALYGYKKDPNDKYKLVVDEQVAPVVRKIFDLYSKGKSLYTIAQTLTDEKIPIPSVYKNMNRGLKSSAYGIWQTRTIDEMLKNPTYAGHLTQGMRKKVNCKSKMIKRTKKSEWITVRHTHEPIVDEDTFNLVQDIYDKNRHFYKENDVLLKGFLYCKECQHRICISANSNGKYYCSCGYYKKYSKYKLCTPHSSPYSETEKKVLYEMKKLFKNYLNINKLEDGVKKSDKKKLDLNKLTNDVNGIKGLIKAQERNSDILYFDKVNDNISNDDYIRRKRMVEEELEKLKKKLSYLENEQTERIMKQKKPKGYLEKMEEFLSFQKTSRALLASLIDRIEIDENKKIDIYLKANL